MRHRSAANHLVRSLAIAVSISLAFPGNARAQMSSGASLSPDLQAAKTALAKYSDPIVAVRDGYFSTVACVDFPEAVQDGPISYPAGSMGVHFLNPANIGPKLDPTKPQILIYEPVGDKLVLVAAEWFVPEQVAGGTAPSIFGQQLAGPMEGHEPIIPASLRHYDLHVWLWKDNPKGLFTSTNATVKCSSGSPYTLAMGQKHQHDHE